MASVARKKTVNMSGARAYKVVSPEFQKSTRALASKLGKEIRARGLGPTAIGRMLGLSKQAAEQMLNGKYHVSAYRLATIAKLLGYRVRLELIREA